MKLYKHGERHRKVVRMPVDLYAILKKEAEEKNMSVNEVLIRRVQLSLEVNPFVQDSNG